MLRKQTLTILSALLVLILAACANIGSPDGGMYDETPPKIVRTSPRYGAINNKSKKIILEFDENIQVTNASEKVVVSPPQKEMPLIEASGKKVTVTLYDTLVPNATYTVDFADAIVDNNEGNPMGDYAFTFSTAERIDTLQVSGNVLDASNLEPIKGMLVGLYNAGSDSVPAAFSHDTFRTKPFERISRTDSRGHFVVKGLAPGNYRVYALQDQNENYLFDQKSEMIAFTDRVITPSSRPDMRQDTVWHDSIHYDSIVDVHYTHFFPDDIVLLAFKESVTDRYFLKSERPTLNKFSLYFTAPSDTLPRLTGLNFDSDGAFVAENSRGNDTLTYWIKDSLIYNNDTLEFVLDYYATDTLGSLSPKSDTLTLVSKLTKEKLAKQRAKAYEEWVKEYKSEQKKLRKERARAKDTDVEPADDGDDKAEDTADTKGKKSKKKKKQKDDEDMEIPPMPEELMEVDIRPNGSLNPDQNLDLSLPEPIGAVDTSKITFFQKTDTVLTPARFLFRKVDDKHRTYRLYAEWEPDSSYVMKLDTGAFVSIYGKRSQPVKKEMKVRSLESFTTLFVNVQGEDDNFILQLLNSNGDVARSKKLESGRAEFYFLTPGVYYMRGFEDLNGNGKWDTGVYDDSLQAESVYYYPGDMNLKAQWEITQTWNPKSVPVPKQKPGKITKQKPDKEKTIKSRNAERERKKNK